MADRRKPDEEEASFLARLERLEKGLDEPGLREPNDPMDGPVPVDSEEVEEAWREGDINALYRGISLRDGQANLDRIGISMRGREHGKKGAAIKRKNASEVHEEWRQQARTYWEDFPDAPIKDVVEDIYQIQLADWRDMTGDYWENIEPRLKEGSLDYHKVFAWVPKPRARSTIWDVIIDLAPKNQS